MTRYPKDTQRESLQQEPEAPPSAKRQPWAFLAPVPCWWQRVAVAEEEGAETLPLTLQLTAPPPAALPPAAPQLSAVPAGRVQALP